MCGPEFSGSAVRACADALLQFLAKSDSRWKLELWPVQHRCAQISSPGQDGTDPPSCPGETFTELFHRHQFEDDGVFAPRIGGAETRFGIAAVLPGDSEPELVRYRDDESQLDVLLPLVLKPVALLVQIEPLTADVEVDRPVEGETADEGEFLGGGFDGVAHLVPGAWHWIAALHPVDHLPFQEPFYRSPFDWPSKSDPFVLQRQKCVMQ